MRYEKELTEMFEYVFPKQEWMDDQEHDELISLSLDKMGIDKQKLSDDIEIGVKNGYTVEQQFSLLKKILIQEK